MASKNWEPIFTKWRRGGWSISNLQYPAGHCGCVSKNYLDGKWRIACDKRRKELGADGDFTFGTRLEAALAEYELVRIEHERLAPWLEGLTDSDLRFSTVSLFSDIEKKPDADLDVLVEVVLRLNTVNPVALRKAGRRYQQGLQATLAGGTQKSAKEHEIAYAYPTSPSSVKHGFGKEGCYTIKVGDQQEAFLKKKDALQHAAKLGTTPGRWSIDHPSNR
jgi:hypothetical protein